MPRYAHIIFDLDGTLIDSAPAILASFQAAFDAAGKTPIRPITADIIGPPLTETLQLLSGSDDANTIATLTEHFKAAYDGEGLKQTTAYDGVGDMLASLHAQGVTLHIATNKRLAPTLKILDMLGWRSYFDSVYALDMVTPRLPNKAAMIGRLLSDLTISTDTAAYVGDRLEDGESASANALPFFAATWGYGAIEPADLRATWVHLPTPSAQILLAA
ncbi:MAG: HAD family hydrolase [Denitromonas halophila]|nr:MAG: HAD family hydrolase [Denitromonas halophila]TVT67552.1 MAG: HAD family hydrolase [Denitromonas halophila]